MNRSPEARRAPAALDRLLAEALACPLCGAPLRRTATALSCPDGHSFDLARQGYASLLPGGHRAASPDTAAMVAAREAFLAAGHYAPLAAELARTAAEFTPSGGTVVDAGCGTGHYLAAVLDALPESAGLGLDVSKYALRRAARAHPRAGAAACDIWRRLPLRDASAGLLLNVFAPRNGPEYRRVLAADGALVVVTPTPRHLAELRAAGALIGVDAQKEQRLRRTLEQHFAPVRETVVEHPLQLTAEEAGQLTAMGPSAHHRSAPAAQGGGASATASFTVAVHRPL